MINLPLANAGFSAGYSGGFAEPRPPGCLIRTRLLLYLGLFRHMRGFAIVTGSLCVAGWTHNGKT